jgi:hypothetical protein
MAHYRSRQRGVCGTTLVSVNEVEKRLPRLVLGWVAILGIPQTPSLWMGCLLWHLIADTLWNAECKRSSDVTACTALPQRMHVRGQTFACCWLLYGPETSMVIRAYTQSGSLSTSDPRRAYVVKVLCVQ